MKRFLIFLLLALFWTLLCIAQERVIKVTWKYHVGADPYTFTGSIDGYNQLQIQMKINRLTAEILAAEGKGLHPYDKINLVKKLAKQLTD